jgi:hypothetical protein
MLLGMRSTLLSSFSPAALFAAGEQGVWYDPSDMTTLFQDSAGTTPVTAVEQPVGRMLDKSGRGNHATQATPSARPVLSARVNLLTKTEQFNDAVWSSVQLNAFGSGSVANTMATTDPVGTNTADYIQENTSNNVHLVTLTAPFSVVTTATPYKLSVYVKAAQRTQCELVFFYNASPFPSISAKFVLSAVTSTGASSGGATLSSSSITSVGNGWYLCTITGYTSAVAATTHNLQIRILDGSGNSSYTGTGTSGIYIWGADLRVANDTALPVYQRVDTSTSYDTTGFPMYLRFDGSDDGMATASINFTSTDAMSVFAGVRKLNDTLGGIIAELSAVASGNAGAFLNSTASNAYGFGSSGTVWVGATAFGFAAPISNVISSLYDISLDQSVFRANGVQSASSSADQGTGNYGNHPLFIGARNQASNFLNGRIYSLIVRGAATSDTLIEQTESWISGEMGGGYYPTGFDFLVDANGDQITDASGNPIITQAYY